MLIGGKLGGVGGQVNQRLMELLTNSSQLNHKELREAVLVVCEVGRRP